MENKMTYTFDEAIDKILFDSFEDTHDYDVVYTEDVISLIKSLKEQYAPTIEMTKEQKEYYGSRTLLSGMSFLGNTRYYTDDVHTITREIALAILHPETIKVVDE